ncbi:hypothetical protein ASPVEDRAFT_454969 [Aspergillus versicolor CBS 583.65]|uniref:Uncharacterized protein n=1 Tax=Aspergillus versicolor CBS 583.65 TaxID=1036611 RepID=A0A1L9PA00_ASPVE|nr:uncharacterized protein ASPVEDRAFT_454969 [Aspergillus versicolor CBS 583.65]OJI98357.1 hypothetical protein ASPVEDRAFT_454969 [Aspergillus versicolor CBS 583.65]
MFRTAPRMAGWVFRENRVPYYQRLFQQHDGKRQWWQTSRSPYIMYPYLISVYGLGAGPQDLDLNRFWSAIDILSKLVSLEPIGGVPLCYYGLMGGRISTLYIS